MWIWDFVRAFIQQTRWWRVFNLRGARFGFNWMFCPHLFTQSRLNCLTRMTMRLAREKSHKALDIRKKIYQNENRSTCSVGKLILWTRFPWFIECFKTTFLHTHSWLNWVDDDEVVLKEKPEDTRYIKKITSKLDPKHQECGKRT